MGWNTAIFFLNDTLHKIDENPVAWAEEISRHASGAKTGSIHPNTDVFHCEHMDSHVLYLIGGNRAVRLGYANASRHDPEIAVRALRDAADKLGYRLSKKPKKAEPTEDDAHRCDRCEKVVENGSGHYIGDDRVCSDCAKSTEG